MNFAHTVAMVSLLLLSTGAFAQPHSVDAASREFHPRWAVISMCPDQKHACAYITRDGMPSSEACAQNGRRIQLKLKLGMDDYYCMELRYAD